MNEVYQEWVKLANRAADEGRSALASRCWLLAAVHAENDGDLQTQTTCEDNAKRYACKAYNEYVLIGGRHFAEMRLKDNGIYDMPKHHMH